MRNIEDIPWEDRTDEEVKSEYKASKRYIETAISVPAQDRFYFEDAEEEMRKRGLSE